MIELTFYGSEIRHHLVRESISYTKAEFLARFVDGYIGEVRKNSLWEEVRRGKARGRLVGGHMEILQYLVGTEYLPKFKNNIVVLEGHGHNLARVAAIFYHYKKLGLWNKVAGVIVGYIAIPESENSKINVEDILKEITKEYDFPILKVRDIGHRTECTPIPIGVKAKIDTSKLSFKILEDYVK